MSNGMTVIRILIGDVRKLERDPLFQEGLERVSRYRREKILRLHFRRDRNLSLGAALLLDRQLATCGMREKDMTYSENAYGKPSLRGCPDIRFSLSHAGDYAVCAVCTAGTTAASHATSAVDDASLPSPTASSEARATTALHTTSAVDGISVPSSVTPHVTGTTAEADTVLPAGTPAGADAAAHVTRTSLPASAVPSVAGASLPTSAGAPFAGTSLTTFAAPPVPEATTAVHATSAVAGISVPASVASFIAGVSDLLDLGIDVEPVALPDMDVVRRCLSESEQKLLLSLPETERAEMFTRLWTLKESFLKAVGTGMVEPFPSFDFQPCDTPFPSSESPESYCSCFRPSCFSNEHPECPCSDSPVCSGSHPPLFSYSDGFACSGSHRPLSSCSDGFACSGSNNPSCLGNAYFECSGNYHSLCLSSEDLSCHSNYSPLYLGGDTPVYSGSKSAGNFRFLEFGWTGYRGALCISCRPGTQLSAHLDTVDFEQYLHHSTI